MRVLGEPESLVASLALAIQFAGRLIDGLEIAAVGGLADAVGLRLQGQGLPNQITDIAPYAITLLAMIGLGLRGAAKKLRNV